MHLRIGNTHDKLDMTVKHVMDNLQSVSLHVIVSHGMHGLMYSVIKRRLMEGTVGVLAEGFDHIDVEDPFLARIVFTGFREAVKMDFDPSTTNIYVWEPTCNSRKKEHKDMMRLFKSHNDFHEMFVELDSSNVFDGRIREIVEYNDGVFEMDAEPMTVEETCGSKAICMSCGRCIGSRNTPAIDDFSNFDSSESLECDGIERGRIVKTKPEFESCLHEIIMGGLKKMPDGIVLYVNRECPMYAEHLVSVSNTC